MISIYIYLLGMSLTALAANEEQLNCRTASTPSSETNNIGIVLETLAITKLDLKANAELTKYLHKHFDYRTRGGTLFQFNWDNFEFKQLTNIPNTILIENNDRSLPDFKNFSIIQFDPTDPNKFKVLTDFNSTQASYTDTSVENTVCKIFDDCTQLQLLHDKALATLSKNLEPTIKAIQSELGEQLSAETINIYKQKKFKSLSEQAQNEVLGEASTAFQQCELPGLKKLDEVKIKYCKGDSVQLLKHLKSLPPSEVAPTLDRCGAINAYIWHAKNNVKSSAKTVIQKNCLDGQLKPSYEAYCPDYLNWRKNIEYKTKMEELRKDPVGLFILKTQPPGSN